MSLEILTACMASAAAGFTLFTALRQGAIAESAESAAMAAEEAAAAASNAADDAHSVQLLATDIQLAAETTADHAQAASETARSTQAIVLAWQRRRAAQPRSSSRAQ